MRRQNPNRLARMMASALKVEGALTEDRIAQVLSPMINDALHLERNRIHELIKAKAAGGGPRAALWRELLGGSRDTSADESEAVLHQTVRMVASALHLLGAGLLMGHDPVSTGHRLVDFAKDLADCVKVPD